MSTAPTATEGLNHPSGSWKFFGPVAPQTDFRMLRRNLAMQHVQLILQAGLADRRVLRRATHTPLVTTTAKKPAAHQAQQTHVPDMANRHVENTCPLPTRLRCRTNFACLICVVGRQASELYWRPPLKTASVLAARVAQMHPASSNNLCASLYSTLYAHTKALRHDHTVTPSPQIHHPHRSTPCRDATPSLSALYSPRMSLRSL